MQSSNKHLVVLTALFLALSFYPSPGVCDGFKPVRDSHGQVPKTALVETPQEALKFWSGEKVAHRTLLLISPEIGITSIKETDAALVAGIGENGNGWDGVLARPYPTLTVYPVQPFNYLYAAYAAGMIDRIYWVPPTKLSVGSEPIENFKAYLKKLYVSDADLASLKQTRDSIQVTVNGIPISIYNLKDLPKVKDEAVALIDLSFFTSLYQDEVKTPILDMFGSFIETLGSKGLHVSHVVISRSTGSGHVPLEYRFIGGYLDTFFARPESIQGGPLPEWRLREQAMYKETFFQTGDVLDLYRKAVSAAPKDASLRYALASAYFTEKDGGMMKEELDWAVYLDKGYYTAYTEFGAYFTVKGYQQASMDFLEAAVRISPDDSRTWETLCDAYKAAGEYKKLSATLEKYIAMGYDWPETEGKLAEAYEKQGMHDKAALTYEGALARIPKIDRKARLSLLLGLAKAYEGNRSIEKALKTYREAADAAEDQHMKKQIQETKIKELQEKWAPFMGVTGK